VYDRDDMPTFGAPSPCSTFLILSLYLCHQADLAAIAIPTTRGGAGISIKVGWTNIMIYLNMINIYLNIFLNNFLMFLHM